MTIKNADVPAIPATGNGMTKREMMALHLMATMLSKSLYSLNEHDAARDAVQSAEALLAALEHTK